jgi:hypothetical protein
MNAQRGGARHRREQCLRRVGDAGRTYAGAAAQASGQLRHASRRSKAAAKPNTGHTDAATAGRAGAGARCAEQLQHRIGGMSEEALERPLESRKLRVAAEQQAELERAVMRDIRQVLEAAKFQCSTIVQQLKENCMQQLDSIEPMRTPHRDKMVGRVALVESGWADVDRTLMPLVDDYQQEMLKQLAVSRSKCIEMINVYRDLEIKSLQGHKKIPLSLISYRS